MSGNGRISVPFFTKKAAPLPSDLQIEQWRLERDPPQVAAVRSFTPLNMNLDITSATSERHPQSTIYDKGVPHEKDPEDEDEQEEDPIPSETHTPSRLMQAHTNGTSRLPSYPDISPLNGARTPASTDGENSPWVGAVGGATTTGKTGRVVERLMADVDRGKRDLNYEIQRRLTLEHRAEVDAKAINALQTENENLRQAKEVDAAVLRRRDRQVDDLKIELDAERKKRADAEKSSRESAQQRESTLAEWQHEQSRLTEDARRSERQMLVLEQSHHQAHQEFTARWGKANRDLHQLLEERADEHRKHKQMELLVEQLQQETARNSKANIELQKLITDYKHASEQRAAEADKALHTLREDHFSLTASAHARGRSHFDKSSIALTESERVMGEARYLLNICKNDLQRNSR